MRRLVAALSVLGFFAAACDSGGGPPPAPAVTVDDFVRAVYPHGVPYDKARALAVSAAPLVPHLLALLDEADMAPARSNIVITLGMVGTKDAGLQLIAFIKKAGSGPLPDDEVRVRLDAVMALGYAAYAAGSGEPEPLQFLLGGLGVSAWTAPRVEWQPGPGVAERLRARCIAALGLSGKPDALTVLQNLQREGTKTPSDAALIAEAIRINQFIAANGMSKYYQTYPG